MENIRNFCIIAHIGHGKSTLADRLLEFTGSVSDREKQDQLLDNMDLERERGITIKSHAVQMNYQRNGADYVLNLIDTPGHVDFSYEVSRSIAACEGALLIVDAAQSIQAQTISNLYLALENDLEIIPVLNKVDLPSANPEEVTDDIVDLLGCKAEEVIPASAKTGLGIEDIINAIIDVVPAPIGNYDEPLQALIFDSVYNPFRGVETYFRVINGSIKKNQQIKFIATGKTYGADEVGTLNLKQSPKPEIFAGDVGYLITGIKEAKEVKVGDTITDSKSPTLNAVEGFEDVKPMVFAGIYPVDTEDYEELRNSMEKLQLNDASLVFIPESSAALGFGFRCGFLGLLHLEIITERLEREFDINLLTTTPGVVYKVNLNNGEILDLQNPSSLPDPTLIKTIEEPWIKATVITPDEYLGSIIKLCQDKRGIQTNLAYSGNRAVLSYELPLNEVVFDFNDRIKSMTSGYASFDYEIAEYKEGDLVKLGILVNGEPVDALAMMIYKDFAQKTGREVCEKLKDLIPRHNFMIPVQAAIGGKIIARETIKGFKKDVLTKIHGGGATDRKRKLLEKQKKGKARSKQFGRVEIPQEAFIGVLKINKEK